MPPTRRSRRCRPAVSDDVVQLVQRWPQVPGVLVRAGFLPYCIGEVEILACDRFGIQTLRQGRRKSRTWSLTEIEDDRLVTMDCKYELELRGHAIRERWLAALSAAVGLKVVMPTYDFEIVAVDQAAKTTQARVWYKELCFPGQVTFDLTRKDATSSRTFHASNLVVPPGHGTRGVELAYDQFLDGAATEICTEHLPPELCQIVRASLSHCYQT